MTDVSPREADRVERDLDLLLGRAFGPHRPLAGLEVTCWCDSAVVLVSRAEVLAGRTASCGRRGCGDLAYESAPTEEDPKHPARPTQDRREQERG